MNNNNTELKDIIATMDRIIEKLDKMNDRLDKAMEIIDNKSREAKQQSYIHVNEENK